MNKMFILLKASLVNSYGLNKLAHSAKSGKVQARTVALASVIVIAAAAIIYTIAMYYWMMASVLFDAEMQDIMLAMIALAGSFTAFFMALYKAPGYLYAARDFNLLAALPVKPGAVLGSKLLGLYVTGFLPCFALTLPGLVVYGIKSNAGPVFYAAGITATLLLPLIPLVIGAVIAFPIMYASARFRFANAVTLILYLALFVALIVGSYALPAQTPEQMEAGLTSLTGITRFYPPARLYAESLATDSVSSWLFLAALSVGLAGLAIMGFARAYMRINAALSERYTRNNFKLENVSVSSVFGALLSKEAKLYFSSPVYVMNTAIGIVLFTIYIIAMAVMGYESMAEMLALPGGGDLILNITAVAAMFCVGICLVTAPSISMEGNSLWILKTLPVRFWDIAKAKIAFNLLVTVPLTVINTGVLAILTNTGWPLFTGMALALVSFCVLMAVLGLIINLYFPKLDWKNPVQAVKQSASVLITMLAGMAITALCGVGFYFSGLSLTEFSYLAAGVITILSGTLSVFLRSKGQQLFNAL